MAFLVGGANSAADTGYDIDNSLRFNYADVAFLANTTGSAGSDRIFTFSYWTKRSTIADSDGQGNNYVLNCSTGSFNDNNFMGMQLMSTDLSRLSTWYSDTDIRTAGVLRDPSAWYHIVLSVDTTQATDTNRVKIYVNGSIASLSQADYPDQNHDYDAVGTSGADFIIGAANNGSAYYDHLHGYLADFYFIDGTAYAASDFGETDEDSGIWKPKKASVTYGTNGFFLEFKETGTNQDSSGIGADTSGNDNHFAVTNLAATDQTTDTPTNNFCTLNPLWSGAGGTLSEGNTKVVVGSSEYGPVLGTIAMTSGKWYWEVLCTDFNYWRSGIADVTLPLTTTWNLGYESSPDNAVYRDSGYVVKNAVNVLSSQPSLAVDETVSVAFDADSGKIWFAQDGAWINSGDPAAGSNEATSVTAGESYYPATSDGSSITSSTYSFNFGNPPYAISSSQADDNGYGNFEFDVPAGFYALCTKNLAEYG